jgi:hypothetical protein
MLALFAAAPPPRDVALKQTSNPFDQVEPCIRQAINDPVNIGLAVALGVALLVMVVCFFWVLIAMFRNGQTALGVITILTTLFCGIGPPIAFFFGWIKSGEWKIRSVMLVWTLAVLTYLGVTGYAYYQLTLFVEAQKLHSQ